MYFLNNRWMTVEEVHALRAKENQETAKKEIEPWPKNPLECPYCGKICKSKLGFNAHVKACKKKD